MILTKDSISKGKGTQVVFQMRYTGTADEIYDEEMDMNLAFDEDEEYDDEGY